MYPMYWTIIKKNSQKSSLKLSVKFEGTFQRNIVIFRIEIPVSHRIREEELVAVLKKVTDR